MPPMLFHLLRHGFRAPSPALGAAFRTDGRRFRMDWTKDSKWRPLMRLASSVSSSAHRCTLLQADLPHQTLPSLTLPSPFTACVSSSPNSVTPLSSSSQAILISPRLVIFSSGSKSLVRTLMRTRSFFGLMVAPDVLPPLVFSLSWADATLGTRERTPPLTSTLGILSLTSCTWTVRTYLTLSVAHTDEA